LTVLRTTLGQLPHGKAVELGWTVRCTRGASERYPVNFEVELSRMRPRLDYHYAIRDMIDPSRQLDLGFGLVVLSIILASGKAKGLDEKRDKKKDEQETCASLELQAYCHAQDPVVFVGTISLPFQLRQISSYFLLL
jgi:hypothetical protein